MSDIMNRALSIRSKKGDKDKSQDAPKHRFTMATLRGMQQPELSKKLFKLIKSENHAIGAVEASGRERIAIASQLSDWGESTGDDALSDITDKLGVLMAEIGEQEEAFGQGLEEYRSVLKQIRNTEATVQPSRDNKAKITDEIAKLKHKEPESTKITSLEQELVRAEAQSLVAEAQLTNVTRQKVKEAYDVHFASLIERAEKQLILARHARRLLNLIDDTPVVPGDVRPAFDQGAQARQVLNDAEEDLREWSPSIEDVVMQSQGMGTNLMPAETTSSDAASLASPTASNTAASTGANGSTPAPVTAATTAPAVAQADEARAAAEKQAAVAEKEKDQAVAHADKVDQAEPTAA